RSPGGTRKDPALELHHPDQRRALLSQPRKSSPADRNGHAESYLDPPPPASDDITMVPSPDLQTGGKGTFMVTLTFHTDLLSFLKREERNCLVRRVLSHKASVKDVIESCGVPHPEVDLIMVNGKPV